MPSSSSPFSPKPPASPDQCSERYAAYCEIARICLGRTPMSREQWDRIPNRPWPRVAVSDTQFDHDKEQQGDAQ